jgi:hypothetical protein
LLPPSLAAMAFVLALPALAEEAAPVVADASVQTFTAKDFAAYAPRNALDMVRRIPGFSIRTDNDGARGFGQANGNVLINGQRVSGKSNSAEGALDRITAEQVVRIELSDGARLGIAGLSGQVVNVITKQSDGEVKGTWQWSGRFRENLKPAFDGFNLSSSGGKGAFSWSIEAESDPQRGANEGPEIHKDAAGNLLEARVEDFNFIADSASLSGSLAFKPAGGFIANLNGKVQIWEPNIRDVARTLTASGIEGRRSFRRSEDEWNGELGADAEFGLGPGRLKLIGLARTEDSVFVNRFTSVRADGSARFDNQFDQSILENEYILRSEYTLKTSDSNNWQLALEGAFNALESDAALQASTGGDPLQPIPLDLANSRVEERRGEFALTHGRSLTDRLALKLSMGAEYSEIAQSGDAEQVREFTRPKGYGELSWKQSDALNLVFKVERFVDQLDFGDFISSVNLNSDDEISGNPDIVPAQAWFVSLTAEKDFGRWGALTFTAQHEDIEDLVDQVPIGNSEGPGNIPSAQKQFVELDGTLKLSPLGFPGGELELSLQSVDSEVKDPLTGETRRFNFETVSFVEMMLRQDVPDTAWAWGLGFENWRGAAYYNIDERGHETANPGLLFATLKNKNVFGTSMELLVGNLLNQRDKFYREVYAPNRLGSLVRSEDSDKTFGPVFRLKIEGNF